MKSVLEYPIRVSCLVVHRFPKLEIAPSMLIVFAARPPICGATVLVGGATFSGWAARLSGSNGGH